MKNLEVKSTGKIQSIELRGWGGEHGSGIIRIIKITNNHLPEIVGQELPPLEEVILRLPNEVAKILRVGDEVEVTVNFRRHS